MPAPLTDDFRGAVRPGRPRDLAGHPPAGERGRPGGHRLPSAPSTGRQSDRRPDGLFQLPQLLGGDPGRLLPHRTARPVGGVVAGAFGRCVPARAAGREARPSGRALRRRKEIRMCCGSRRSAWRAASASTVEARPFSSACRCGANVAAPGPGPGAATVRASAEAGFPSVELRYTEAAAIRVRGPVTGRRYDFSGAEPVQPVDVRDAAVLTRNSAFRRLAS